MRSDRKVHIGIFGSCASRLVASRVAVFACGWALALAACGDDSTGPSGVDGSVLDTGQPETSSGSASDSSSGSSSDASSGARDGGDGGEGGGEASSGGDSGGRIDSTVPDSAVPDSAVPDSTVPDSAVVEAGDPCTGDAALLDSSVDCCPNDPLKTQPGVCGCGVPDTDTDLDGTPDCIDMCPTDPTKTAPGTCGCGVPDVDSDGDGVPDCIDACPSDPTKTTSAGVCGCGRPDVDTDHDGTLDCLDGCPKDGTRTQPGPCGCGAAAEAGALCLAHRYTFDGTGTTVTDTVGGANGTTVNGTLSGTGTVVLAGGTSGQYVNLPSGTISSMGNSATFEVWVTWTGGLAWQRIFDFGTSDQPAGMPGVGQSYLFLTPLNGLTSVLRADLRETIGVEAITDYVAALPTMTMVEVAVVIDGVAKTMSVYQNGVFLGQIALGTLDLNDLPDVNNWLGRSQFAADPSFMGTIYEFRIYSAARTAAQVLASFTAGPDTLPAQ